jgi:hypothetical protein
VIVARVVLQDVSNVVGIRGEIAVLRADSQVGHVAKRTRSLGEDRKRIAFQRRQHAEEWRSPRTGWPRVVLTLAKSQHLQPTVTLTTRASVDKSAKKIS